MNYKLVVAANRDEFYDRPAKAADFWINEPDILAGIDIKGGGTWMGLTRQGKIAMLTNYRDLQNLKYDAPSRGHLVSEYLKNGDPPLLYLENIPRNGEEYNGYNLIVGSPDQLYYQSNYAEGILEINPGVHGLSNQLLNSDWPKVSHGKRKVESLLADEELSYRDIFEMLYDEDRFPDEHLPNTGVGIEMERMLSSMFIKSPTYGSRCTTVILIDYENRASFHERTYDTSDFSFTERSFDFQLQP